MQLQDQQEEREPIASHLLLSRLLLLIAAIILIIFLLLILHAHHRSISFQVRPSLLGLKRILLMAYQSKSIALKRHLLIVLNTVIKSD